MSVFLLICLGLLSAPNPGAADTSRLIKQLASNSFAERESASRALEEIGEPALKTLRAAAKSHPDAEVRRRAGRLLESVEARLYCQFHELLALRGHQAVVWSVAFSPDGRYALSGSGWLRHRGSQPDCSARVWHLETSKEVKRFGGHNGPVREVAFSPDGMLAISTGGAETTVWNVRTGKERSRFPADDVTRRYPLETYEPHTAAEVMRGGAAFFLDARRAISGATVWDTTTGQALFDLRGRSGVSVAVSADGHLALFGNMRRSSLCGHATPAEVEAHFRMLGALYLADIRTGEVLCHFEGHRGRIMAVAFCQDGRHVLSGSEDGTVRLWDRKTGRAVRCLNTPTLGLAFSPDRQRVLSGSDEGVLALWDIERGKELRRFAGHRGAIHAVAISPDGRRALSAGQDGIIRLWELPD